MNASSENRVAGLAVPLLGVSVHRLTWDNLKARIAEAVEKNQRRIIANHNLHSVYLYHHDGHFRSFYSRADLVHVDA